MVMVVMRIKIDDGADDEDDGAVDVGEDDK